MVSGYFFLGVVFQVQVIVGHWRVTIVNLVLPVLQPDVTHQHIRVVGLLEFCILVEVPGPQVNAPDDPIAPFIAAVDGAAHWMNVTVSQAAGTIPEGGRAEKRQYQVAAVLVAPFRQGLAQVFIVIGDSRLAGDIKKTQQTDGRVEQEAPEAAATLFELALQDLVDDGYRGIEVPEEISNTALKRVGHDLVIAHGDRPHDFVETIVECINLAVKTFPGVIFRIGMAVLRTGAAEQQQAQQDADERP